MRPKGYSWGKQRKKESKLILPLEKKANPLRTGAVGSTACPRLAAPRYIPFHASLLKDRRWFYSSVPFFGPGGGRADLIKSRVPAPSDHATHIIRGTALDLCVRSVHNPKKAFLFVYINGTGAAAARSHMNTIPPLPPVDIRRRSKEGGGGEEAYFCKNAHYLSTLLQTKFSFYFWMVLY